MLCMLCTCTHHVQCVYDVSLQRDVSSSAAMKGSAGFANMDLLTAMKCQATFLAHILQPALLEKKKVSACMHCSTLPMPTALCPYLLDSDPNSGPGINPLTLTLAPPRP